MALMEFPANDGMHIDPVFLRGINFIWTADRAPDGSGFVVYFYDGVLSTERADFSA